MRISRIYSEQPLAPGERVELHDERAHYLGNVLRLQPPAAVILFNGDGNDYYGEIAQLGKKRIMVRIDERRDALPESPLRSLIGLGISRGDRMDYALQKCTELGVSEIVPLFTAHGEVKLKGERLEKRLRHWRKVVISACEQCGRARLPLIHDPLPLGNWLAELDCSHKFVFDQNLQNSLDTGSQAREAALLIGPEGGLAGDEIGQATRHGFRGIRLGPRVLRTETAPVAALTLLQYLWGDF